MTDATEFSQDPYEDGTVPADADLKASDSESGSAESGSTESGPAESDTYNPQTGTDPLTEDEKDRAERHY